MVACCCSGVNVLYCNGLGLRGLGQLAGRLAAMALFVHS